MFYFRSGYAKHSLLPDNRHERERLQPSRIPHDWMKCILHRLGARGIHIYLICKKNNEVYFDQLFPVRLFWKDFPL
jgi:hypothetical protein